MKKHPAGFRSITQRIVLALVLIILPFNIISVIVTIISLQNARQQMMTSVDNLLALSGQQLSGRMNAMNDFFIIWTAFIRLSGCTGSRESGPPIWRWQKAIWPLTLT